MFPEFQKLFLIGDHAYILKRRLRISNTLLFVLKPQAPREIMEKISAIEKEDTVLIGLGNIGGVGKELVNYWEKIGKPYDF